MARKNLSRTVIEGGRGTRNQWDRRRSHRVERASTRAWLDTVSRDHEEAEESAPPPIEFVSKDFSDKLGPAQRWLAAQAGRPWSKVYSELRARFDSRTVAGRHVVEDHMLDWVRRPGELHRYYRSSWLYVDDGGILRKPALYGRAYQTVRRAAIAWFAGRVCARTYRGWWWFRYEMKGDACFAIPCRKTHYTAPNGHRFHQRLTVPIAAMTRGEVRYLDGLADEFKRSSVIASPWPAR